MHRKALWLFGLVFVLSASMTAPLHAQCTLQIGNQGLSDIPIIGTSSLLLRNQAPNTRTLIGIAPNGTGTFADLLIFHDSDGTTANYEYVDLGYDNSQSHFHIGTVASGTGIPRPLVLNAQPGDTPLWNQLSLATSGNVGIGTTGPMSKLHVVGRVLAQGYDIISDVRLKQDITPLTGILEKLDKVRGVSFQWNAQAEALGQATGQRDIGVLAQEVAAVFPELVTARSAENYQSVDYSKMTAVLLEAVKELRIEVKALKTENQVLKQSISGLKSK